MIAPLLKPCSLSVADALSWAIVQAALLSRLSQLAKGKARIFKHPTTSSSLVAPRVWHSQLSIMTAVPPCLLYHMDLSREKTHL